MMHIRIDDVDVLNIHACQPKWAMSMGYDSTPMVARQHLLIGIEKSSTNNDVVDDASSPVLQILEYNGHGPAQ